MEAPSKEVQASIDALVEYNYMDEMKDYESKHGELAKDYADDPDALDQDHIFSDLVRVQQYLSQ